MKRRGIIQCIPLWAVALIVRQVAERRPGGWFANAGGIDHVNGGVK